MTRKTKAQCSIPLSAFSFLASLQKNNNRDWFNAHKGRFLQEQETIGQFAHALLLEMNKHDEIETATGKKSLHRIYRDTRFSADKTPYKTYWSGNFKRATKYRRGGYYFQFAPRNSFIAGGFWAPVPSDLKLIRDEIAFDADPLRKILNSLTFKTAFGELKGEQLKTAPRGYANDHDSVGLLRYKQFLLIRTFTDQEVLGADFLKEASRTFQYMRPFFDYMSEILTTDANGLVK
jgi:uncharacterized protein (TIGR02453 family)